MKKGIIVLAAVLMTAGCSGKAERVIEAPGVVDGDVITMKSRVASAVEKIYLDEGSEVRPGDTLVSFDSRVIGNQIKGTELNLESVGLNMEKLATKKILIERTLGYLKDQVERFERLNTRKSVSGDDLEKLRLRLLESETSLFEVRKSLEELAVQKEVLENKKEYLDLMMEDYHLSAPGEGVVLERFVSRGENVFPGIPVMDILDRKSLYVEIFVEEKELFSLKSGGSVRIRVDGAGERDLKGVISVLGQKAEFSPKYVISEVERKALLYKVKISIRENTDMFKIGMPVTVLIDIASSK
jgi:HlyD family secretion protein